MPSSRPHSIPFVISLVTQINPDSILDLGVGFGKWGVLFREYTDIIKSELDPPRYQRENWKIKIEGIEGFAPYITPLHNYIYDAIYIGDILEILPTLGKYDLVFIGDVIEHFPKEQGKRLIRLALEHTNRYLILTTPRFETNQPALCANELERHRSLWTAKDFRALAPAEVLILPGEILLTIYPKPGQPRILPVFKKPASKTRILGAKLARKILGDQLYQILRVKLKLKKR